MPVKPGSATVPVPGYDVRVLDERGERVPAGVEGAIVIALPLPPGTLATVWGDDQRFVDGYLSAFPGLLPDRRRRADRRRRLPVRARAAPTT